MAADIGYESQVITLIKSLSFHHTHLRIYLLHKTFPKEWFESVNAWLKPLNSEIIPAYVHFDFSPYKTAEHITEVTYYRFLIPSLPETERIIYLDCDIVINGELSELMSTAFDGKALLAVEDFVLNNVKHCYRDVPHLKPYFNAGVFVINLAFWRRADLTEHLLQLLKEATNNLIYADQDLLNILLCQYWKALEPQYNFQTDAIFDLELKGSADIIPQKAWLSIEPSVIHYTSSHKPWTITNRQLFREKYWFYYRLQWQEIYQKWQICDNR